MKHDTEDAEENAVSNVDDLVVAEDTEDTTTRDTETGSNSCSNISGNHL